MFMRNAYKQSNCALSISTWFCLPHHGMKDFEILNRASAFLVSSRSDKGVDLGIENQFRKIHVLTASHVAAPWKWPKYYPDEWLKEVNEKFTYYTVELRSNTGNFMFQAECLPYSYHHGNRDLACLHFEQEKTIMDVLTSLDVRVLDLDVEPTTNEQDLLFHGHEVVMSEEYECKQMEQGDQQDYRLPFPYIVSGKYISKTKHQTFARTTPLPLVDGMCGGPVMKANSNKACGLVEGIVPLNHPQTAIQGLAVYVEGKEIYDFISNIESNSLEDNGISLLRGTEALKAVSSDQDPEKLNMEATLKRLDEEDKLRRIKK